MEFKILDFIQTLRNPAFDAIMVCITHLGDAGILWLLLSAVLIISRKYRRIGMIMIASLAVEALIANIILKPTVARIRPYDINTAVTLIIGAQHDYSFPSGHTTASFAAATVLFLNRFKYWPVFAVLAVLIAFSRLYLYVHFPSDVLAGAVIGILAAIAVNCAASRFFTARAA